MDASETRVAQEYYNSKKSHEIIFIGEYVARTGKEILSNLDKHGTSFSNRVNSNPLHSSYFC